MNLEQHGAGLSNNPVKREPVALGGALILAVQAGARYIDWPISEEDAAWIANALSAIIVALIRQYVMPVATVKAAGLSPDAVVDRAKDPAVMAFRGP